MKRKTQKLLTAMLFWGLVGFVNAQTHFQYTPGSNENATVGIPITTIPRINGSPLELGDEIGVFTPGGMCVGARVWNGTGMAITVWGDDGTTSETIEGIRDGEQMHYRVWRKSTDTEYSVVTVTYASGIGLQDDGIWHNGGTYVLSSLEATAPPDAPEPVSPEDGAINVPVSTVFQWSTVSYADSYHLQISSDQEFTTLAIDQTGLTETSHNVSGLAYDATYYWRVRASNAAGAGSFSALRTFTTAPPPPSAPTLNSPPDGSTDHPRTLTLAWNEVTQVTLYHLQVSTDPSFGTTVVNDSSLTDLSRQVGPLANGTRYHWRVRAKGNGGFGDWSQVWNFTIIPQAPAVPLLAAPPDGSTDREVNLTLTWRSALRAAFYHLQLSMSTTFSTIAFQDSTITDTLRVVGPLENGVTYHWRVRAGNSGGWSGYSTAWDFTTKSLDAPTAVTNPPTNITATSATLRGTVNPKGLLTTVKFGFGTTPAHGSSVEAIESPVSGTEPVSVSNDLRGLQPNTTYYYSVGAFSSGGTTEGDNVSFTTKYAVEAPVLHSPEHNAEDQPLNMLFRWFSSPGATTYRIQVATDSLFASLVSEASQLTDTSHQVDALNRDTQFYWRVQAQNSIGASPWSEVRSFTTIPPLPESPLLYSPANGASEQPLTIQLVWRRSLRADSYRVQVALNTSFSSVFFDSSSVVDSSLTVRNLSNNTTYYWRVLASNSAGVSEWSSTWRFTTFMPPPATPSLLSPAKGSSNVSNPATLSWSASTQASSYRLQVATDAGFSAMVIHDSTITSTSSQRTLELSTTYYWRVRGENAAGVSSWSTVWDFTTIPPAPATPVLASPPDGSADQPRTLTLSWNSSTSAEDYSLQVSTDQTFATTTVDESSITATSREVGPLASGATYYWRTRAGNAGGTSDWSQAWSFTTAPNAPGTPILSSPADGAEDQPTTLPLNWTAVTGAERYRVQVATSVSFESTVVDNPDVQGTSMEVGPLATSTRYYWRVLATNQGGSSDWSDVRSFTTIPSPPPAPVLSSPTHESADQPTTLLLAWEAANGASTYHLQVSTGQTFTTTVVNDSTINEASRQVSSLSNGSDYYWRVRAKNAGGTSAWSSVWKFTTSSGLPPPPATPILTAPPDGASNTRLPVTLAWNSVSGASSYSLQVSANSNFSSPVVDRSDLSSTNYVASSLAYATTYYWRVLALNQGGSSNWSTVWSFTTALPPPSAPSLLFPADNAHDVPVTVTLRWSSVESAESYHLQVSTKSDFKTVQHENSTLNDTLAQPAGLKHDERYYWRVRAANNEGPGPWSNAFSFSTVLQAPEPPQLAGPADGSQAEPTDPVLSWHSSLRAASYRVQLSQTASFTGSMIIDRTQADTSTQVSGLANSTIYYWRVSASNKGGTSSWTPVWSLKTLDPTPSSPTLVSPTQDASNQPTALELRWSSVSGAARYQVQLASSASFDSPMIDVPDITETRYYVNGLEYGRQYYWRVRGSGSGGQGPWSSTGRFSTASEDPLTPELSSPPNGATGLSTSPTLSWNAVIGATGYDVQVSSTSDYSSIVESASNLSATSYQVTGLAQGTVYYWHVRARTVSATGAWSVTWSFSTIEPSPSAPLLALPEDNAPNLTLNPSLSWNAMANASAYRVEISKAPGFTNHVMDTALTTETMIFVGPLEHATRYYWRVSALNSTGSSPPSVVRSFVTHNPSVKSEYSFSLSFPSAASVRPLDYRLFGLPGPASTTIGTLTNGSNGTGWRAYMDNGLPDDYLVEIVSSEQLTFGNGRAYWLIHNGALSLQTSIPAIPLNSANQAEIPLQPGWNIVTNPFSAPVDWETVRSVNGISSPLWHFENGFSHSDSLRPFCGYYMDNASNLPYLKIPNPQSQSVAAKQASTAFREREGWAVGMVLVSGNAIDKSARFGIHPESKHGRDPRDVRRPRALGEIASIVFRISEGKAESDLFASDFRPRIDTVQSWEFRVVSPGKSACSITFEGIESIPHDFAVALLDESRKKIVDLRQSFQYDFSPMSEQSVVKVVVGLPEAVEQMLPDISIPDDIILGQNYPNPFNPSTLIPVSLPAPSHVTLTIYNTLGQSVMVLHNGVLDRGYHTFLWNGRDSNGDPVSTGLYFSRLTVEGNSLTRKLMLVK